MRWTRQNAGPERGVRHIEDLGRQNARRAELKREARDANLSAEPDAPQPPTAPKRLLGAVAELWERKKARAQLPSQPGLLP